MATSASAAGVEPQKQLLSIILDSAAEKSNGERRASGLKRRLEELLVAADAAAAELEAAKRALEAAEEELSASQAHAANAAKSIQALEATISHLPEKISIVGSELEALKSKEDSERDEFLRQVYEMNAIIRQFQQMVSKESAEKRFVPPSTDGHNVSDKNEMIYSKGILKDLADKVSNIDAKVQVFDAQYQKDLCILPSYCKEDSKREEFLIQLYEMNARIRQFQQMVSRESVGNALGSSCQMLTVVHFLDGEYQDDLTEKEEAHASCFKDLKRLESLPGHNGEMSHLATTSRERASKDWCGGSFGCRISTCEHGGGYFDSSDSSEDMCILGACALTTPSFQVDSSNSSPFPSSPVTSVLPPLLNLDVPWVESGQRNGRCVDKLDYSSSFSESTVYEEIDIKGGLYCFEGPAWEAVAAPFKALALEEEEQNLLLDATISLGSDRMSMEIIKLFDESGQPGVQASTCREFLLSLPAIFLFKEQRDAECAICRRCYSPRSRSV